MNEHVVTWEAWCWSPSVAASPAAAAAAARCLSCASRSDDRKACPPLTPAAGLAPNLPPPLPAAVPPPPAPEVPTDQAPATRTNTKGCSGPSAHPFGDLRRRVHRAGRVTNLQRSPGSLTSAGRTPRLRCKAVSQGGVDGGAEAWAGRRGARRPRVPSPRRLIDCRPLRQSTLPIQRQPGPPHLHAGCSKQAKAH